MVIKVKNKNILKIIIFALACILLFSVFAVSALAATPSAASQSEDSELDKIKGEDLKMSERVEYALQGTVTGLLMVFAVLTLLFIVVSFSKVIFYDLPRKARENAKAEAKKDETVITPVDIPQTIAPVEPEGNDGELAAVITAAIAAMLESGEYKNEFAGGFRVVSFKRANTNTWNKR